MNIYLLHSFSMNRFIRVKKGQHSANDSALHENEVKQ